VAGAKFQYLQGRITLDGQEADQHSQLVQPIARFAIHPGDPVSGVFGRSPRVGMSGQVLVGHVGHAISAVSCQLTADR
jgi:hypothetical protein